MSKLEKLLCWYIEERKMADLGRVKQRKKKYNIKDELIESLNTNYKTLDAEILFRILGIVSRNKYHEMIETELDILYKQLAEKNLRVIYDNLVSYKNLLRDEQTEIDTSTIINITIETSLSCDESSSSFDDESSSDFDEESYFDSCEAKEEKKPKIKEVRE